MKAVGQPTGQMSVLSHGLAILVAMHADTGRRYRAYPTPEQAGRLTSWGHSCRAVWNLALEQRRFAWRQRGRTVRLAEQCRHLTDARADLPWLADLPAQSAQQVLRQLDRAYDNWWNPEHPARAPTFRKRSRDLSVPFPGQAVQVRRCSRRWAEVRLPKLGWVRFRLSRPLGGMVRNASIAKDALGWHVSFGVAIAAKPAPPNRLPSCGVDFGVACSAFVSDEREPRLMPSTLTVGQRRRLLGWSAARAARSPGPRSTTMVATPTGWAGPSARSPSFGRARRAVGRTSSTSSPPTSPRTTAGSPSRTCG
jgi:putative transposase